MSCSEIRSLLTLRSLDLLEEAERASVESHLAGCAPCRLEVGSAGEVAGFLKSARKDERPPERVWEALAKSLDAAAPAASATEWSGAAPRALQQLACAHCTGGLTESVHCSSCLAPYHAECFTACTVHGCKGATFVSARAPRRTYASALVLLGVAAIGAIFFMQQAYDELLDESRKNAQLERDIEKFIIVKKPAAPPKVPDRIDVSCDNEDLRKVLDRIGQRAQQNIVAAPDVKDARVSINLRDVRWRDAVCLIASFVDCDVIDRGDVVVLAKPIKLPEPEKLATDRKPSVEEPAPPAPRLEFKGFIETPGQRSSAIINGRGYWEGDEILGRDNKSFSPKLFVVKIHKDGVEYATGSRDGPRTLLGR